MSDDKIIIKPYPHPHPNFPDSNSRFEVIEKDEDGNGMLQPGILREANFEYEVCEFIYDRQTSTAHFKKEMGKDGKVVTEKDKIYPYIPNDELISLARLVQVLQRPVLLKGEPGSGKTQLAKAIAYEWYGPNYRNHYFEWHIKSSSKATDGLYSFDHIARLRDATIPKKVKDGLPEIPGGGLSNGDKSEEDLTRYRSFGSLAKAFLTSTKENPSILLIDEIDKADIDFPNDLLLELDERRFKIPETGEVIRAHYPPVIFITSNDERELPEAFLRRCLFMFIRFPDKGRLIKIIEAHLPGLLPSQANFVNEAIDRFDELRFAIEKDAGDNKRVSTSELLDWLKAFDHDIAKGTISGEELTKDGLKDLPLYYHALLKTIASYKREHENKVQ